MGPETDPKGAGTAPTASRRAELPDDSRLSAESVTFLSSLEQSVRPYQLAVRFPRIVNNLARLWQQPGELDRYLDDLLVDTRGNRQGFPLRILTELVALKEHSRGGASSGIDVWANRSDGERKR
jgi:hypothetical protein